MVYNYFVKKSLGSESMPNQELAEKLHKPIIRKFEKRKVYSSFKDNIWGPDLADTQLLSKLSFVFYYLLLIF